METRMRCVSSTFTAFTRVIYHQTRKVFKTGLAEKSNPARERRLYGKAIDRGPFLGRAIAVRRAAPERNSNLTRPRTPANTTRQKWFASASAEAKNTPLKAKGKRGNNRGPASALWLNCILAVSKLCPSRVWPTTERCLDRDHFVSESCPPKSLSLLRGKACHENCHVSAPRNVFIGSAGFGRRSLRNLLKTRIIE